MADFYFCFGNLIYNEYLIILGNNNTNGRYNWNLFNCETILFVSKLIMC